MAGGWLAAALVGVGLVVLVLSLFMSYVGRMLVRDDTFADRIAASLEDQRVAEFVALRSTDRVIAQKPDLTAVRPILVVVTRGIVGSPPFRAMVRPAVAKVHGALLSSTAENILLAVPDVGVLIRESLKSVGPAAAERVPRRLEPVLQLERAAPAVRAAGRVLNTVGLLRPFGRVGAVVGLLLLLVAIIVSPTRRATMLAAGVGVATVGAVPPLGVSRASRWGTSSSAVCHRSAGRFSRHRMISPPAPQELPAGARSPARVSGSRARPAPPGRSSR